MAYQKVTYGQCEAISHQTGNRCKNGAMMNGKCRFHGGRMSIGVASANYIHGRYSKYLPKNLLERYESSLMDPKLLELMNEISLVDARISQRLEDINEDEVASISWKELQGQWRKFTNAIRDGDQQKQQEYLRSLNEIISGGAKYADLWFEVMNLVDSRRKLVDSESRRVESQKNAITIEQALMLASASVSAIKEIIYKYVDPQTARTILTDASIEYARLIGTRNPPTEPSRTLEG